MNLQRLFHHHDTRPANRKRANRRPVVECLEGRQLLATFTVTNTNSYGAGSLVNAINASNATSASSANIIKFQIPGSGIATIKPLGGLQITRPVVIDGTTQPGYTGKPRVQIDGSLAGAGTVGFSLYYTDNSTIKGLSIVGWAGGGVLLHDSSGINLTNDYIGVTPAGNVAKPNWYGVNIERGTTQAILSGDVISGNLAQGVVIQRGSYRNTLKGSFIGTDSTGTAALGNGLAGVAMWWDGSSNTIGGTATADRNVISGNVGNGINIQQGSNGNNVLGNLIGTNLSGTAAIPNGGNGIGIGTGSDTNTIGGTAAHAGNTISGNRGGGILITDYPTYDNLIQGNFIGTNATLSTTLGNRGNGVAIFTGADSNTIGGTTASSGNTISNNRGAGIEISSAGGNNLVEYDLISSNGAGQNPTYGDGVYIWNTPGTSVINCTINSNRDWGIVVARTSDYTFTGNRFNRNGLGTVLVL